MPRRHDYRRITTPSRLSNDYYEVRLLPWAGRLILSALVELLFSPGNSVFPYLVGLAPCPGRFQGLGAQLNAGFRSSLGQPFTLVPSCCSDFPGRLSDCIASCGSRLFSVVPYVSPPLTGAL